MRPKVCFRRAVDRSTSKHAFGAIPRGSHRANASQRRLLIHAPMQFDPTLYLGLCGNRIMLTNALPLLRMYPVQTDAVTGANARGEVAGIGSASLRGHRQVGHHRRKETAGFTAGNRAMVEGERQRQHFVHGGRAFGYDDLIANSARTHNRDRRRNNDR